LIHGVKAPSAMALFEVNGNPGNHFIIFSIGYPITGFTLSMNEVRIAMRFLFLKIYVENSTLLISQ